MALIQMDLMATSLQQFVNIAALIPAEQSSGPYPVLYLLSDIDGGPLDFIMQTPIAPLAMERGIAVIMVAPASHNGYRNIPEKAENMETFVADELVQVCRRSFSVCKDSKYTFIAGLGAGGEAAVRLQKMYPEVFGKAKWLEAITPETANETMRELLDFLLPTEGGTVWPS